MQLNDTSISCSLNAAYLFPYNLDITIIVDIDQIVRRIVRIILSEAKEMIY